jgi:ribosomal protein S18 acetylase RimI-like enzyme
VRYVIHDATAQRQICCATLFQDPETKVAVMVALKPETELQIVFDQAGGRDAQFVRDHLDIFNVGVTGESAYYPVHFFLKNTRGETMGGLLGSIWGGWLHITFLWCDEAVRGQRWATRLMDQAEAYARERRCHSVELDTTEGIMRMRGKWTSVRLDDGSEVPTLPTFHPAYLLRTPASKRQSWLDLLALDKKLKELGVR